MTWISVKEKEAEPETDYLISDGINVGFGYFVPEYDAEDPRDPHQYTSEYWHQEGLVLKTNTSGFPEVTHYMELPKPPKKS